jgi:hypothetical protein
MPDCIAQQVIANRDAVVGRTMDDETPAWIRGLHPQLGRLQPEITEQYISVGVGRDYSDVYPRR